MNDYRSKRAHLNACWHNDYALLIPALVPITL
jgi:hypothetical protein